LKLSSWAFPAFLILLFLAAQIPLWGYWTDDTYIHMVYAKNLVAGHGWSFNPGEASYGSTSPLWVLLLAPWASTEAGGLLAAKLLGILAALISILLFHKLSGRFLPDETLRRSASFLFATEVWFLRWSASGMESSLAVLALLLILLALSAPLKNRGDFFRLGLFGGLACLVRPEFYLFGFLLGLAGLLQREWRKHLPVLIAGLLLPTIPWLLFAQFSIGSMLPSTGSAKAEGLQGFGEYLNYAGKLLRIPLSSQGLLLILALATLGSSLFSRIRSKECYRPFFWITILWATLLPLFLLKSGVALVSRYLLPVTPLIPLAAMMGLRNRLSPLRKFLPLILLLSLLPNLWLYSSKVLPHARQFPREFGSVMGEVADWLSENDPGSRVACPDIGLIGYRSDCYVVDLVGLIHPDIADIWHQTSFGKMIEELDFLPLRDADYLIERTSEGDGLDGLERRGRRLVIILEREVPGLGIARDGGFRYRFYRIERHDQVE
jgi:hypothetical protein